MFTKKIITVICFAMLVSIGFVACKKDAFSEKDAIAAQTALLQTKFDNERSLEQLRQSGATALAQLNYQLGLLASSRNALQQDSINRAYNRFLDSLSAATGRRTDSLTLVNQKRVDIIVSVRDIVNTNVAVSGATVLLPTTTGTVLTATTDANGIATFPAASNINVPATVQAIVSKTGYSTAISGFFTRNSGGTGSTTVQLWNNGNLRNTVTGTVTIDANLTNTSVETVTGQLITITNTFNGTQNFFTAVTNASGVYSIGLPDNNGSTVGAFSFLPVSKDTTHTLWVNGLLPGTDSIPSIVSVPARFTLQQFSANTFGTGTKPAAPAGSVPSSLSRFYGVVDTKDSLGRSFYIKGLTPTFSGQDQLTQLNNWMFTSNSSPSTESMFDASGSQISFNAGARYSFAQVAQTGVTNLPVRFVDLLNNSDNVFVRRPSLQAGASWNFATPTAGYGLLTALSLPTSTVNPTATFYGVYPTRSTATGNLNGYLPTALAQIKSSSSFSNTVTVNRVFVNSGFSLPALSIQNGGTTTTINLTFGVGTLTQGVR
ncbi:MAG: hypothetical protein FD136_643 [Chitinophagaceae bacterium]|nr:MAG: hypothetical protein FD183_1552 [Chitinophagaceae bacterium]TXT33907.1 MAG: hypothetical protein FD136_643 [Chitinophagaceae bacterium]